MTGSSFCETGWNGRPRRRHICWAGGPGIWDIVFLAGSGGCQKPDKLITSDMGQSSFWRAQAGPPEPLSRAGAAALRELIARRWGWRGTGRGLRPCPHLPLLWLFAEQGPSDTVLGQLPAAGLRRSLPRLLCAFGPWEMGPCLGSVQLLEDGDVGWRCAGCSRWGPWGAPCGRSALSL